MPRFDGGIPSSDHDARNCVCGAVTDSRNGLCAMRLASARIYSRNHRTDARDHSGV